MFMKMYLKGIKYADMSVLQRNDKGAEVALLQKALIERNYLYDVANGFFGAKTEQAVTKLQSEAGLLQTGIVDGDTWKALENHTTEFVAQDDIGLVLYTLEFEEEGNLRFYVKNMDFQAVSRWQCRLAQFNDSKELIGSFDGKEGCTSTWTITHSELENLKPGEITTTTNALDEGRTGKLSSGESYTITYFPDTKYAGVWPQSYTTGDGTKHIVVGSTLYAEIIR